MSGTSCRVLSAETSCPVSTHHDFAASRIRDWFCSALVRTGTVSSYTTGPAICDDEEEEEEEEELVRCFGARGRLAYLGTPR